MERFAEDAPLLQDLRDYLQTHGVVEANVIEGKEEAAAKYADYFDYQEPLAAIRRTARWRCFAAAARSC